MLEFKNVSIRRAFRTVLSDLSLSLPPHSLTALIGKNGCGKSTLIASVLGECKTSGELLVDGIPIKSLSPRERAKRIAVLPQSLRAPHMTVKELVTLGRHPYLSLSSTPAKEDAEAIARAIDDVGIKTLEHAYLDEISGGERQKAYLAMILAQDAPLLLLDEPTTYMDLAFAHQFMTLLRDLKDTRQRTLLVAMHDLSLAVQYADRIALLDGGRLAFHGTVEDCLAADAIEHTFGVRRLEADGNVFFVGN